MRGSGKGEGGNGKRETATEPPSGARQRDPGARECGKRPPGPSSRGAQRRGIPWGRHGPRGIFCVRGSRPAKAPFPRSVVPSFPRPLPRAAPTATPATLPRGVRSLPRLRRRRPRRVRSSPRLPRRCRAVCGVFRDSRDAAAPCAESTATPATRPAASATRPAPSAAPPRCAPAYPGLVRRPLGVRGRSPGVARDFRASGGGRREPCGVMWRSGYPRARPCARTSRERSVGR